MADAIVYVTSCDRAPARTPTNAHRQRRREARRDVGARAETHFASLGGEHDTGAGAAAHSGTLGGAVPPAEKSPDDRTGAGADGDLAGVLTLRGRSQTRQRRGLQVVAYVPRSK